MLIHILMCLSLTAISIYAFVIPALQMALAHTAPETSTTGQ